LAENAKSSATPVLKLGGQHVKSVGPGFYWILSSQMTKTFRTTAISILCSKQAASLFFPMF